MTVGVGLILLVVGMAISIIMAFVQKSEDKYVSEVETVYVVDDSGLDTLYVEGFSQDKPEKYPNVSFDKNCKSVEEALSYAANGNGNDAVIHITEEQQNGEKGYLLTVYVPENGALGESDADTLGEDFSMCMSHSKLLSSGISYDKVFFALSGVDSDVLIAGEEPKSMGEQMVQMFLPMLLMLFMYMITLMYGMSIGTTVSIEKSSKLMETMLTFIKPYGLIVGKVFAMAIAGIIQIAAWAGGFVAGFFAGDYVAKTYIYDEYENVIIQIMKLLGQESGAFTVGSVLLGAALFLVGFILFCALAAFFSSFSGKSEELGQANGAYSIALVASFFAAYMLPLQENEFINVILRLFPTTAAMKLPGDVIVGNIPVWQGGLYGALLLVCTVAMCVISGVIYKKLIFNRGKSLKDFFGKKSKSVLER